MACIKQMWYK